MQKFRTKREHWPENAKGPDDVQMCTVEPCTYPDLGCWKVHYDEANGGPGSVVYSDAEFRELYEEVPADRNTFVG